MDRTISSPLQLISCLLVGAVIWHGERPDHRCGCGFPRSSRRSRMSTAVQVLRGYTRRAPNGQMPERSSSSRTVAGGFFRSLTCSWSSCSSSSTFSRRARCLAASSSPLARTRALPPSPESGQPGHSRRVRPLRNARRGRRFVARGLHRRRVTRRRKHDRPDLIGRRF